jgi:ectoine hydroxylase-related dioxygenase (phytanoyl-CoA dioxygenase family)
MLDSGYRITEGVLSFAECDALRLAIASSDQRHGRAGARNLMANHVVASVASDSRLLELAAEALGRPAVPYRATLFDKSYRPNWLVAWHQDTVLPLEAKIDSDEWGPWSAKAGRLYAHAPRWALERIVALRIHLAESTADNGPLRVIPASHHAGVLSHEQVLAMARPTESLDCLVGLGGVLTIRPLLIHASSKARLDLPRPVIHIEYADNLELRPGVRLALA